MKEVPWDYQTDEPTDPPAIVLEVQLTVGGQTRVVTGTFDTGADMTELQPPYLDEFGVDEDGAGFTGTEDGPEPVVIAIARFDDHEFEMPVHLARRLRRSLKGEPIHVFGRTGLMDHFKITSDPQKASTTFEWQGRSPKSRLEDVKQAFVTDRIGKIKAARQQANLQAMGVKTHGPGKRKRR